MPQHKLNDYLKSMHQSMREDTANKVREAIEAIREFEGEKSVISANKLVNITGLSRSVLYKSHILEVWNPTLWNKRYGKRKQTNGVYEKEIQQLQEGKENLEEKLKKLEFKCKELETQLKQRKEVYKMDIKDLESQNAELLGENLSLKSILRASGINYEG
jgi:flagellar biosynthesis GTPase FlhF